MIERLLDYAELMRLHRPIGIYLLLWPTLWALWLAADGSPRQAVLLIFITGVVVARSAGCVINDYVDRNIDPLVSRTRQRPIASGRISARQAIAVFVVLSAVALGLVLMTNTLTALMSLVALALAISYPFMKRFHALPQLHLGLAFGWAIPMAYTAQTGSFPPATGWLLYLASICWSIAYDTIYAMADKEDDRRIGVKSTALLFGNYDRLMIGVFQLLMLSGLALVGYRKDLDLIYYAGLLIAAVFFIYQQYLIRHRQAADCITAFSNNNYVGMAVFAALLIALL